MLMDCGISRKAISVLLSVVEVSALKRLACFSRAALTFTSSITISWSSMAVLSVMGSATDAAPLSAVPSGNKAPSRHLQVCCRLDDLLDICNSLDVFKFPGCLAGNAGWLVHGLVVGLFRFGDKANTADASLGCVGQGFGNKVIRNVFVSADMQFGGIRGLS
jgi:hypothetical protein